LRHVNLLQREPFWRPQQAPTSFSAGPPSRLGGDTLSSFPTALDASILAPSALDIRGFGAHITRHLRRLASSSPGLSDFPGLCGARTVTVWD